MIGNTFCQNYDELSGLLLGVGGTWLVDVVIRIATDLDDWLVDIVKIEKIWIGLCVHELLMGYQGSVIDMDEVVNLVELDKMWWYVSMIFCDDLSF